ncbi:hypothetical protein [Paenibacillus sp. NPDC057967]|uniref:hypothetical protein n=1 Tax=Paenibacillus sp. NPDC057967 TaxID=3346293 RepID=UPI0036DE1E5D
MKLERVYIRNSRSKADFIMRVEEVADACYGTDELRPLFDILTVTIEGKAAKYARRWKRYRLEPEDFESIFYESVWTVAFQYFDMRGWDTDFYYYETLLLVLDRRAVDYIRKMTGPAEALSRLAVLVADMSEPKSDPKRPVTKTDVQRLENEVIDRVTLADALRRADLTETERAVIVYMYTEPDVSYREIAAAIGLGHGETVRRAFGKAAGKLRTIISE